MTLSLREVAYQLAEENAPLPDGVVVWVDFVTDSIWVGESSLLCGFGFKIPRANIDDNLHHSRAKMAIAAMAQMFREERERAENLAAEWASRQQDLLPRGLDKV